MTPQEIKIARVQLGMSYREFANALELQGKHAPRTVRRFESGDDHPSEVTVGKIKTLLSERLGLHA